MNTARAIMGDAPAAFAVMTLLFAAAAAMTGQALARNWRPAWQIVPYTLLLGIGDRFLLYALFEGMLLSAAGYVLTAMLLMIVAAVAWRRTQVWRMVTQYPWLYERAGWLAWRARQTADRA